MRALVLLAAAIQGVLMLGDEGHFHRARGLPKWERIGHPLDTLTVLVCYGWLCATRPSTQGLWIYSAIALFSCVFVTKDEFVHRRHCAPAECWLHALLFIIHPIVLAGFAWAWLEGDDWLIRIQLILTAAFGLYQILYWNFLRAPRPITS